MPKAIVYLSLLVLFSLVLPCISSAQIAPGAQQSAAQTGTITGTVVQSDGTLVAGADIRLIGPAILTTKSDTHGAFAFTSVPYGTYRVDVTMANLGTASRDNIIVKGDITVAIQYITRTTDGLKTIARVSTRSAGAQINVTSASIASITPSEYAFQGNTSWKELLDQIPGVAVGGDLFGGIADSTFIPGSPIQPIVISINGGLSYETSVTLDGMPLENQSINASPGAGSDLSFLPMATFDTADVVRGPGADAPSIVDSIGGSFVLHAPGLVDKNQFEFSISNDPYGGIVSNAKAALHFGRFSATILYGVNDSPGPFGARGMLTGDVPPPLTVGGQAFAGCAPECGSFPPGLSTPNYQRCFCEIQSSLLFDGIPVDTRWTQHSGALSLAYNLTPSITAQVFYAGSSSEMPIGGSAIPTDFAPGSGYSGGITPGLHNLQYSAASPPWTQSSSILEEKIIAYTGHGVLRLAALQSNSFANTLSPGFPNGRYTVYGTGYYASAPATPVNFNGVPEYLTFTPSAYNSDMWSNNRDILASYATQVGSKASFGISYVTSYYNDPSWFYCSFDGFPASGSQSSAISETTDELRIHAGTEISDKLSMDASWYFARGTYHIQNPSDPTGNTWTNSVFPYSAPRLGVVWKASRDIAVRAAVGGGYALPPLSYLVGTNFISCSGIAYCTQTLTNINLTPEKSFGFDLGTDMRFKRDTVLSLDIYRTNLYGQFFTSFNLTGTFTGLPLYTSTVNNLAQSRFEGINFDIRHDVPHGIYWHGALGLTRAYVVSVPAGFYNKPTCTYCKNTYVVPGINFDGVSAAGGATLPAVPYTTAVLQFGYRWAPGKYIDLSPTYYGNDNPYYEPAFVEFDAHAGYALTRDVSLVATFRNITGIYGQSYTLFTPSLGAPSAAGEPYALTGLPYGPRSLIVTAVFK